MTVPGWNCWPTSPPGRPAPLTAANARQTDWVTLLVPSVRRGARLANGARARAICDPDDHRLLLVDRAEAYGFTEPAFGPLT